MADGAKFALPAINGTNDIHEVIEGNTSEELDAIISDKSCIAYGFRNGKD